jgi:hypothetical protein
MYFPFLFHSSSYIRLIKIKCTNEDISVSVEDIYKENKDENETQKKVLFHFKDIFLHFHVNRERFFSADDWDVYKIRKIISPFKPF